MSDFLKTPLFICIIALVCLALFIKYSDKIFKKFDKLFSKKKDKTAPKIEVQKAENVEKDEKPQTGENPVSAKIVEVQEHEKKKSKFIKKPTITRVFEAKKKIDEVIEQSGDAVPNRAEEEFLKKMEFAKTGKVAKVRKIDEQKLISSDYLEEDEEPDFEKDEVIEKNEHFDKSRRVSRCLEDGSFDDLFASHLKDDYLKIDESRHLNLDDKFVNNLYGRTEQTLANSKMKLNIDKSLENQTNIDSEKSWIEDKRREFLSESIVESVEEDEGYDEILRNKDISLRNIALSSLIMKRKNRR